ncbi:YMGG-like glycine zipper-containing protein [Hymenobacter humi]|uniref:YMGG-like glycine zipper-containing protein n=1 Tax=Hymenobacter humi TaxID=1411620 RepID=A0ABW2UAY1_9BACT
MKKLPFFLSLIMLLSAMVSAPSAQAQDRKGWSPQAKGAVIGGLGGAAAGAIINKRNRPVGGLIGGVAGGAVGYGVGKHIDNKQKERARIAANNRAVAARREAARNAANRAAIARNTSVTTRTQTTSVPANSLVAAPGATAMAYDAQGNTLPAVSNAAYLPNEAYGNPSHPYSTSEYRRKSW